jgi:hypothetical protein
MGFPQIVLNPSELLASLFPKAVFIGDIEIDVISIEEKLLEWEHTERPVDAGLDVTDTRKKRPVFMRIEGFLTDSEISADAIGTSLVAGQGFNVFGTWEEKRTALESLADSDEIIQITTRRNVRDSMQITSLKETATKDNSKAYQFVLEAKQVRQVSSEFSFVDPSQVPKAIQDKQTSAQKAASAKTKAPTNAGKKLTKDATPKDVDPLRTAAQALGFSV